MNPRECPNGMVVVDAMTNSHATRIEGATRKNIEAVIDDIMNDCVISGWEGSHAEMTMPDRMVVLFGVRQATYGPEYQFSMECPRCEMDSSYVIDMGKLPVTYADDDLEEPFYTTLPVCGKTIAWRLLRVKDESAARMKQRQAAKAGKKDNMTSQFLLARRLLSVDDIEIDHVGRALKFVKNLSAHDTRVWTRAMEDVKLGYLEELEITCRHCDKDHTVDLPFSSDFFRPELAGRPEESQVYAGTICVSFAGIEAGVHRHNDDASSGNDGDDRELQSASAGNKTDAATGSGKSTHASNDVKAKAPGLAPGDAVVLGDPGADTSPHFADDED